MIEFLKSMEAPAWWILEIDQLFHRCISQKIPPVGQDNVESLEDSGSQREQ